MTIEPKLIFGIVVRSFGLYSCFEAIVHLLYYNNICFQLSNQQGYPEHSVEVGYLLYVAAYSVIGLLLLYGADAVVDFTYRSEPASSDSNVQDDHADG